jgi:hypothetical protein
MQDKLDNIGSGIKIDEVMEINVIYGNEKELVVGELDSTNTKEVEEKEREEEKCCLSLPNEVSSLSDQNSQLQIMEIEKKIIVKENASKIIENIENFQDKMKKFEIRFDRLEQVISDTYQAFAKKMGVPLQSSKRGTKQIKEPVPFIGIVIL